MKEILENYQIRKTNKQKTKFLKYLLERLQKSNYSPDDIKIEEKGIGPLKSRNVIVGNPETADFVVTAHYDTPAISLLPNFMFPTNIILFIIFQILLTAIILISSWALSVPFLLLLPISADAFIYIIEAIAIGFVILLMFGPANRHCANDNTSGVITLIKILEKLPEKYRKSICVVFFDNEEKGLWGSQFFAKQHKNVQKDTLVINMDCVGDGQNILMMSKRKARKNELLLLLYEAMKNSAKGTNINFMTKNMKPLMFPSDQSNFDKGVGVCSLRKSIFGMYAGRIHTPFDTKCDEQNLEFLSNGIIKFSEAIHERKNKENDN